jgi:hypothetical protein
MPRVGDKHYPYTAKGKAAAKAAAKRKGVKVSHGKGYNKGGSVKSRVNLGAGAPKRKKRAAKKMQGGGPAINPNVNVLGVGAAQAHQAAQRGGLAGQQAAMPPPGAGMAGPGPMLPPERGRPPAPRIRPGMKKGGGVKKKKGGGVRKKRGGSVKK